ncbi:uncharacterized protein Bfra_003842 [Botrytis fragariae]|uniref:Uncharacterized protein n=1 Tax=Botrytis fragariae TaxID=1964551 RepID=A0A8H6EKA8_9HELO|nr:uncharacterized protein Bfra_003842 [Botrytis fragariae]KAF5875388.1 hypothetical protein Bfra_003842 [Botrytis fragariae]
MPQQIMLDPPLTENDPGPLNTTVRTLLFENREREREREREGGKERKPYLLFNQKEQILGGVERRSTNTAQSVGVIDQIIKSSWLAVVSDTTAFPLLRSDLKPQRCK